MQSVHSHTRTAALMHTLVLRADTHSLRHLFKVFTQENRIVKQLLMHFHVTHASRPIKAHENDPHCM